MSTKSPRSLSDDQLIEEVKRLAAAERRATAALIRALIEFDTRQLYLREGCSSLFTYCTQELHLSEASAFNRIKTARAVRRFPGILHAIEDGALTLTSVRILAPHLTEENHTRVLACAAHRSRREVEELVAALHPQPPASPIIRRVGGAMRSAGAVPSERTRGELSPALAHEPGGDGSRTRAGGVVQRAPGPQESAVGEGSVLVGGAGATALGATRVVEPGGPAVGSVNVEDRAGLVENGKTHRGGPPLEVVEDEVGAAAMACERRGPSLTELDAGVSRPALSTVENVSRQAPLSTVSVKPVAPELYRLHVTLSTGTFEKLGRAQRLLRHAIPSGDPAEILDRALTLLVDYLERRRFAAVGSPREPRGSGGSRNDDHANSRHIPAAVRRAVWRRDDGRCAFVGRAGRCRETAFLEFHHVQPYAAGGAATADNIQLRCRAHNQFEARLHFGGDAVRETVPLWGDEWAGTH